MPSENPWTSGPWEVQDNENPWDPFGYWINVGPVFVPRDDPATPEQNANARLVALADEMAELLEKVGSALTAYVAIPEKDQPAPYTKHVGELAQAIEDVLARARGEQA